LKGFFFILKYVFSSQHFRLSLLDIEKQPSIQAWCI